MPNIYFPNLNLSFQIDPVAFRLFGLPIYWYGIILTTGIVAGLLVAMWIAQKENFSTDLVMDFLLIDIVCAIIGARCYYVVFNWSYYKNNLTEIFNIRQGGIAIYGAILASLVVAKIYTKMKNVSLWQFVDILTYGVIVGQAIGRYGNFVNKEAYGDYTNSFFAMRLLKSEAAQNFTPTILENIIIENGVEYIQVHPTFLYESVWNLGLLIILLIYRPHKKAQGEIFFFYLIGYGVGRFWIEGLRTDQLLLPFIHFPISQVVALLSILLGSIGIIICRKKNRNY